MKQDKHPGGFPPLMTTAEVAALMRVNPSAVLRWAAKGRIAHTRTSRFGHYRYREDDVLALFEARAS